MIILVGPLHAAEVENVPSVGDILPLDGMGVLKRGMYRVREVHSEVRGVRSFLVSKPPAWATCRKTPSPCRWRSSLSDGRSRGQRATALSISRNAKTSRSHFTH